MRLEPGGRAWRVTVGPVHVVPQPLGTVLAQLLDARGQLAGRDGLEGRVSAMVNGLAQPGNVNTPEAAATVLP